MSILLKYAQELQEIQIENMFIFTDVLLLYLTDLEIDNFQ